MANPTGHTYRFGEHNPLKEQGGPRPIYCDPGQGNFGQQGNAGNQGQGNQNQGGSDQGMMQHAVEHVRGAAESAWGTVRDQAQHLMDSPVGKYAEQGCDSLASTVSRYPIACFFGAVAAGFLL